jgi:hypothetical protein
VTELLMICKRCNTAVDKNKDQYELFEGMHWVCFHLEFEHIGDPDVPCEDPSCFLHKPVRTADVEWCVTYLDAKGDGKSLHFESEEDVTSFLERVKDYDLIRYESIRIYPPNVGIGVADWK